MRRNRKVNQTNWRKRLLELSLEVAIAVAFVFGIALYAIYGQKKFPVDGKWVVFGLNTAFVFGTVIKLTKPLWKKAKLWLTLSSLLVVNGLAGWMVLRGIESVGTVWYVPVVLAEIYVIVQILERAFTPAELEAAAPATHHVKT